MAAVVVIIADVDVVQPGRGRKNNGFCCDAMTQVRVGCEALQQLLFIKNINYEIII